MNFVDQIISEIDKGIKFSLDNYQKENRQYPAADITCLLYTSPSPRDAHESRMPSSA